MKENHRLEGVYITGNCNIQITGGEPYILINLEKFWELKNLKTSHSDFVYLLFKNNEYHIFMVEMKCFEKVDKQMLNDILNHVKMKFYESKKELFSLLKNFSINVNNNSKIHKILVIPDVHKINALLPKLTITKYKEIKIIPSGKSIWDY